MKRAIVGVFVLLVAVSVVVLGVVKPWKPDTANVPSATHVVTVKGVIGSEKKEFFTDPKVEKVFAKHGFKVEVDTAGSREIATTKDLKGYDFAFPGSSPAAQKLVEKTGAKNTYAPFYSPMAVATWKPVIQLLADNGVASKDANGVWQLDASKYLALVSKNTRWSDLKGAATLYNSPRSVLLTSTDIRKSNSAAMYLAIATYVLNGNSVVSTPEQQKAVLPEASKLFLNQGFSGSSSDEPFQDYLTQGSGSSPLVMVYESQFVGEKIKNKSFPSDAVLAYITPTVFSKHVIVPLTTNGDTVGKLLTSDPELQKLAADHGFRTSGDAFKQNVAANKIPGIQENIVNVAETPSYDTLENLIDAISKEY
jgi:hypothetical protein